MILPHVYQLHNVDYFINFLFVIKLLILIYIIKHIYFWIIIDLCNKIRRTCYKSYFFFIFYHMFVFSCLNMLI